MSAEVLAEGLVLEARNHGVRLDDDPVRVWYVATDVAARAMAEGKRVRPRGRVTAWGPWASAPWIEVLP